VVNPGPTIESRRLFWRGVPRKVSYLRGGRRAWLMTLPTAAPPVNTSSLNKSINLTLRFMVERVNQNLQRVEQD
jgi:hypothetical protein